MRPSAIALLLCTAAALPGCTMPQYANVPAVEGDTAVNDPNLRAVWRVEAVALRHVLELDPPAGKYAVRLPEGTSEAGYDRVLAELPEGAVPANTWQARDPVYGVEQVRIRSFTAQADVSRPDDAGQRELVSAYLATDIEGWYARRHRIWRLPVEQAIDRAGPGREAAAERAPNEDTDEESPENAKPQNESDEASERDAAESVDQQAESNESTDGS